MAHDIDIYRNDAAYVALVAGLVADGLRKDEACVAIATKRHREALERRLRGVGVLARPGAAPLPAIYVAADAAATLAQFMVDGMPDRGRFEKVVGDILRRARGRRRRPVRAFGEMVALLAASEGAEATLALERRWNLLLARHSSESLVCSYPARAFSGQRVALLEAVCRQHHAVYA